MAIANPAIWRPNTQQWIIAEALIEAGFARETPKQQWKGYRISVRRTLDPTLGTGVMVFKGTRHDGTYGPLEHNEQGKRLWYRIHDVMKAIAENGWDREAGIAAAAEEAEVAPVEPIETQIATPSVEAELRWYVAEVRRIRDWLTANDPEGEIDHISYRPIKDGRKMIEAGIPAKACLHAMTLHWERSDRQRAGIVDYDPAAEFPGGLHAYLETLANARVLIMLTGPAGMGKSYWTKHIADKLGLDRGSVPMNEGAGPSWFLGKDMASGYKESKFQRLWREGGVIALEEMDAGDSNLLLLVNDALANDVLDNPVCGDEFAKHADCIVVALTNTLGMGADDKYVGRNELDFSTLDRFRMGRAFVGYNREVEDLIAFG